MLQDAILYTTVLKLDAYIHNEIYNYLYIYYKRPSTPQKMLLCNIATCNHDFLFPDEIYAVVLIDLFINHNMTKLTSYKGF